MNNHQDLVGKTPVVRQDGHGQSTSVVEIEGMQIGPNRYALSHGIDQKWVEIYRFAILSGELQSRFRRDNGEERVSMTIVPFTMASQHLSEELLAELPHYDSLPEDFFFLTEQRG